MAGLNLIGRRGFMKGAIIGGASGVLGTTGMHVITHALESHDAGHHADIGFCTDMSAHHMQALVMCERVLGSDSGGAVQSAATEVLRNQGIEVGMMRAWLADWGASTAPPVTVMGWMAMSDEMSMESGPDGEGVALADMPGYASDAELGLLSTSTGLAKGRIWLELMRAHHVGGVAMARAASELAATAKVVRLAKTQAEAQSFEIGQYDQLLDTIYA